MALISLFIANVVEQEIKVFIENNGGIDSSGNSTGTFIEYILSILLTVGLREIMQLVKSVCLFVCLSVHLSTN